MAIFTSGKKVFADRSPVRSVADCTCCSHQQLGRFHYCADCCLQAIGPSHCAIALTEVPPHQSSGLQLLPSATVAISTTKPSQTVHLHIMFLQSIMGCTLAKLPSPITKHNETMYKYSLCRKSSTSSQYLLLGTECQSISLSIHSTSTSIMVQLLESTIKYFLRSFQVHMAVPPSQFYNLFRKQWCTLRETRIYSTASHTKMICDRSEQTLAEQRWTKLCYSVMPQWLRILR